MGSFVGVGPRGARRGMLLCIGVLACGPRSTGAVRSGARGELKGDVRLDGKTDFPWSNLLTLLAPDHTVYNSTDAIHSKIESLMSRCPELTHDTRATPFMSSKINETRVLKVTSVGETPGQEKTRVLITFGIHGREYVASEVALAMIYKLCDGSARSTKVLANTEFVIIPVFNVAGRKKMGAGIDKTATYSCSSMRKNAADVDLNRNFDFSWTDGSDISTAEDYRGPSPNSEPETQLLDGLAREVRPKLFIDVHSGDTTMMYPYSYESQSCHNAADQQELADYVGETVFGCTDESMNVAEEGTARTRLISLADGTTCPKVGNAADSLSPPYLASGSTLDYMYEVMGSEYSYTWEVYAGVRYDRSRAEMHLTAPVRHTDLLARPAKAMDAVVVREAAAQHAREEPRGQQHALLPESRTVSLLSASDMALDDCFAYFNPTSADELARTAALWSDAAIAAAEHFIS